MSDREIEEREIDDAYDRGFEEGLTEAWRRVNVWIRQGELSEPANSERNGMILAANLILDPQEREPQKASVA
jgi:hypothetical protein